MPLTSALDTNQDKALVEVSTRLKGPFDQSNEPPTQTVGIKVVVDGVFVAQILANQSIKIRRLKSAFLKSAVQAEEVAAEWVYSCL